MQCSIQPRTKIFNTRPYTDSSKNITCIAKAAHDILLTYFPVNWDSFNVASSLWVEFHYFIATSLGIKMTHSYKVVLSLLLLLIQPLFFFQLWLWLWLGKCDFNSACWFFQHVCMLLFFSVELFRYPFDELEVIIQFERIIRIIPIARIWICHRTTFGSPPVK